MQNYSDLNLYYCDLVKNQDLNKISRYELRYINEKTLLAAIEAHQMNNIHILVIKFQCKVTMIGVKALYLNNYLDDSILTHIMGYRRRLILPLISFLIEQHDLKFLEHIFKSYLCYLEVDWFPAITFYGQGHKDVIELLRKYDILRSITIIYDKNGIIRGHR